MAQLFLVQGDLRISLGKAETITTLSEAGLRRLIAAKIKMLIYQRDSMVYEMGYRGIH
ncbi:hypothetical protein KSF_095520 [Reticulibacter mediterranei]|uniref:Uncharacterized protein n=1 Tax=Reticulibacter mediterranei TaxID=2778369 RepID=A0A8J3N5V9_9CHLR|nr:hypothetical protein [Reticulibacter mediterranei]GHO99504.1 hypothetical protein KSF_095520 [Reticulibacter mediterranei]